MENVNNIFISTKMTFLSKKIILWQKISHFSYKNNAKTWKETKELSITKRLKFNRQLKAVVILISMMDKCFP